MATRTKQELTDFLHSYDVNESGAFDREQWLNLCTGTNMNLPEDCAAELFDRLDMDKDGKVTIDELLTELAEWEKTMDDLPSESDSLYLPNKPPNNGLRNGRKAPNDYSREVLHRNDRHCSIYESSPEEINADFRKSLREANKLKELISESYPELAGPFQQMLQRFNKDITEKQSEQAFLQESFEIEKQGRKQDLERLEKELDGQMQLVETRLRNDIRKQLEVEYQDKVRAKEIETKRLHETVNDLKQQQIFCDRKLSQVHMNACKRSSICPSGQTENGDDLLSSSSGVLTNEQMIKNDKLVNEAVKLRKKLQDATHQLQASEKELEELGLRLDQQTSELLVERMKCSSYVEEKDLLHGQVQKMRDALYDMVVKHEALQTARFIDIIGEGNLDNLPQGVHAKQLDNDSGQASGLNDNSQAEANDKINYLEKSDRPESVLSGWSNMDALQSPDRIFRIIMVGDSSVGKTCFMHRFCTGEFLKGARSTVEPMDIRAERVSGERTGIDFKTKNMMIDGNVYAIEIWDTAGQEKFHSIAAQYFRKCDGAILMYDVSMWDSFVGVRDWITILTDSSNEDVLPKILVGNKIDIRDEYNNNSNNKSSTSSTIQFITTAMGQNLAKINKAEFMETSVLNNKNVDEVVVSLVRAMKVQNFNVTVKRGVRLSQKMAKSKCCNAN